MNPFIEYAIRGMMRSEDAIKRLNRNVRKLAKCNTKLTVAGILLATVVAAQYRGTKALKKQVSKLTRDIKELKDQEGA